MIDLSTCLSGIPLKNPVMPASGTFGYGHEMARFYDLNLLGAVVMKGTTQKARFGNETPRIAECAAGVINAIGLQNPGIDAVIETEMKKLRAVYAGPVVANISGFSAEEYAGIAERLGDTDAAIFEINISCPNVRHGGMAFGTSESAAAEVTKAVRRVAKKPVYMKLSPNVTSVSAIARACADEGADGIVLINTLLGMRIDPRTGRAVVSTGAAGFSGPAIKPVALRMVHEVSGAVSLPVVGVGGVASADDVIEMLSAGASAVQVGAANLVNPFACRDIVGELPERMKRYGIQSVKEIIGRSHRA